MPIHVDNMILNCITDNFKTIKEISVELTLPYVRVAVRLRQMRKRKEVISQVSNKPNIRGVKPLCYRILKS